MHVTRIRLPAGEFTAHFSERGLARLDFPSGKQKLVPRTEAPDDIARWHRLTEEALRRTLSGKEPAVLPPLDVSAGTPFQQRVWGALRRIGVGRTMTYGQIAGAIGKPKAARAVGSACGANPIPVLIPCHRVLAGDGSVGGFSAGLKWKERLLASEGITVAR
jgi:methylated-DNA-[protein]-cysteine S-methyltransferase